MAEEVEKVNPDLVARDENGEIYTVRYEAVNAMLLNEFLKEHRKMQEQEQDPSRQRLQSRKRPFPSNNQLKLTDVQADAIARQQKGIETVAARLQEQDSKIQKVSAQLELSRPVPRMVLSNQ